MNWSRLFRYDSGVLYLVSKPCKNKPAGIVAGSVNKNGYRYVSCFGKKHKVSHIVWEMHNPTDKLNKGDQIDHINHNRADDRIENLRKTNNKGNSRNRALLTNNKSGYTGVYWRKDVSKWRATIRVDGEDINLGCFYSLEEAVAARKAAEASYGFHENHGQRRRDVANAQLAFVLEKLSEE